MHLFIHLYLHICHILYVLAVTKVPWNLLYIGDHTTVLSSTRILINHEIRIHVQQSVIPGSCHVRVLFTLLIYEMCLLLIKIHQSSDPECVMEWLRKIEEQFCWWGFNTEPELCCVLFQTLTCFSRWWQLKYFVMFTPKLGEDEPILKNIFFSDGLVQPLTRFVFFVYVFECWFILAIFSTPGSLQDPPLRMHSRVPLFERNLEVFNVGVRF